MKVLVCFGTRPEAIKMSLLSKKLKSDKFFECKVCITGQHRQMLDQVTNFFDLEVDYDLNVMSSGQSLFSMSNRLLMGFESVFNKFSPDYVMVHGDTTTAFFASLSALYSKSKVAHVEAGLRTNDIFSPWPEEANRQLITRLSDINFAPTKISAENLIKEGVSQKKIIITGNTVIDALLYTSNKIDAEQSIEKQLYNQFNKINFKKKLILVTGHRRENFGEGFKNICKAIKELSNDKSIEIIYPVHLNPNVQGVVKEYLSNIPNIHLINPLEYLQFVFLMKKVDLILTDSGGIQEEAPSLGKPVLVMRDTTERPEALEAGTIELVGTNKNLIIKKVYELLENEDLYKKMSNIVNPYGIGDAAKKIIEALKRK